MLDTKHDKLVRHRWEYTRSSDLNQRIVPSITNKNCLEADVMRTRNGLCILILDVAAEDRPVVPSVTFYRLLSAAWRGTLFRGRHIPVEKWKESLEY